MSEESRAEIRNATFSYCTSWYGGIIIVQTKSSLVLKDAKFIGNQAMLAGVFFLNNLAYLEGSNLEFEGNYAVQSAIFHLSGGSNISLTNASVTGNMASYENSIGMIIEGMNPSLFKNVTFSNNVMMNALSETEDKGIEITATAVQIKFTNCQFNDNQARFTTANIYMNKATNMSFENCLFINKNPLLYSESSIKGGFIHLIGGSSAVISNSIFTNGRASIGGAIFMLGDTSLTLSNCQFTSNTAVKYGGAIAAITFSLLDINTGS